MPEVGDDSSAGSKLTRSTIAEIDAAIAGAHEFQALNVGRGMTLQSLHIKQNHAYEEAQ
jgi:hypothetical protein